MCREPEATRSNEMPDDIDAAQLVGRWVHAHEEDHEGRMVFRPSDVELPPSRGRTTISLNSDGTAEVIGPGPDDRRRSRSGHWTLEGRRLSVSGADWSYAYDIDSTDPSALVVRRP